jgi:hypothetical protein
VRRFPPPWTAEQVPGGFVVKDATGQAIAYVYGRETRADADTAKVLTMDEARRGNIAKLRTLLADCRSSEGVHLDKGLENPSRDQAK